MIVYNNSFTIKLEHIFTISACLYFFRRIDLQSIDGSVLFRDAFAISKFFLKIGLRYGELFINNYNRFYVEQ
jgi:hypothetical protein